jgi:hypothetical protein
MNGVTLLTNAKNNGTGWNFPEWSQKRLIDYLVTMMGKTLQAQTPFGKGAVQNTITSTGTLNDKGLFYGGNSSSAVKVFGIEQYWGNHWQCYNGVISNSGRLKFKLCEGTIDGSTTELYNDDGTGYIDSGVTLGGTSGQIIKEMTLVPHVGLVPTLASGTNYNQYYCAPVYYNLSQTKGFGKSGGANGDATRYGTFTFDLYGPLDNIGGHVASRISYKAQPSS